MPKVERRVRICSFLTPWQTSTPGNTKCPINVVTTSPPRPRKRLCVLFGPRDPFQVLQGASKPLYSQSTSVLASSLGARGRVQPHEAECGGQEEEMSVFVWVEMRYQRFLMAAPLECGGNFGRQGSSAPASWENTESSPEEQVELRVSG